MTGCHLLLSACRSGLRLLWVCCLLPAMAMAQPPMAEPGSELDAAWQRLLQLDGLAEACHSQLESEDATALPGQPCRDFMAAMHGEIFLAYRRHCETALLWRENEAQQHFDAHDEQQQAQDEALLESLMRVEYLCGSGALLRRSEYIAQVYSRVDDIQQQNSAEMQRLHNRIADLEFVQRSDLERQRLLRSLEQMQQRQRRLGEDIAERQELEFLRQEMRRNQQYQPR